MAVRSRAAVAIVLLGLLAAACSPASGDRPPPTPDPPATWAPPQHRITIEDGRFVDRATGTDFVPRGVNYLRLVRAGTAYQDRFFSPAAFDRDRVAADFAALSERGYNTVRLFLDLCGSGPDCVSDSSGPGVHGAYLDVIAEVTHLAAAHDLLLLLTSNDLPDGYWAEVDEAGSRFFPGYRNSHLLTPEGHAATARYWEDLMSGLAARQPRFDVVLGWSILNEQWLFSDQPPLSLSEGEVETVTGSYDLADREQRRAMVVDATRALIATTAEVIRRHDPYGLVTMGFFAPQFPNETQIGGDWYVDTAPLVAESDLDFFDFHAYPGEDIGLAQIAENFGVDERKPVVMGEVGAFVDRYPTADAAATAVQLWMAESCDLGFDGWIYWGYLRSPLDDATWSFTDEDGFLLDALAPTDQPDPCTPTRTSANAALGAAVTASNALRAEPPELAVDGDAATWWGAGADAPQWIEIDLGAATDIVAVRLNPSQYPAGRTVHRVDVARAGRDFEILETLSGETADNDVLEIRRVADGVRFVRVTTVSSPSWVAWREIEVLTR